MSFSVSKSNLLGTGLSWFKRVYVTSRSWENTQNITLDGNNIRVTGISKYNVFIPKLIDLF